MSAAKDGRSFGRELRLGGDPKDKRSLFLDRSATALALAPGSSMAEIAEALGVGRATLYRYFPSRDDLISELALSAIRATDNAAATLDPGLPSYRAAFEALFAVLVPFGDVFHFLAAEARVMRDPRVRKEVERQSEEMIALIDQAKRAGELDASLPSAWIAAHFDALIWAGWSSVHEGKVAPRDVAGLAFRSFWCGVASCLPPGR